MREVRIEDLREPRRTGDEQAFYEFAVRMEVDLNVERMVAEARHAAGLHGFGDDTLLDRLAAQVAAIEADARAVRARPLHRARPAARASAGPPALRGLRRRHPEALEVELEPPVIVVGLPRSGTTHLVNLSGRRFPLPLDAVVGGGRADPGLGDGPGRDGVDPRYLRCLAAHIRRWRRDRAARRAHARPPAVEHRGGLRADRPGPLLLHARVACPGAVVARLLPGAGPARALRLPAPGAPGAELPARPEPVGPQDTAAPRAARPAARHVSRMRPSRSRCATRSRCCSRRSRCSPTATGCGASRSRPTSWPRTGSTGSSGCCGPRSAMPTSSPTDQRVDVEFGEFMADDLAMADKILAVAGLEVTDTARSELTAYLAGNPRGKDGRVVYDLRGDFGLEPDAISTNGSRSTTTPFPRSARRCADCPGSTENGPAPTPSPPSTGAPAVDLGDGIWHVAGPVQQLPARRPTTVGSSSTPAWASRVRSTAGPTTPSTDADPGRSSSPRATTTTSAASTCLRDDDTDVDRAGELRNVAGRQRTARDVPGPQRRVRVDATPSSPPWSTPGRSAPAPTATGPAGAHDHVRRPPRAGHRRAPAGAAVRAGRRDHRLARRLAPRVPNRVHREPLRARCSATSRTSSRSEATATGTPWPTSRRSNGCSASHPTG